MPKYQYTVFLFFCLIIASSSLTVAYEYTDYGYFYEHEETITPGDFIILNLNFSAYSIEDHVLYIMFQIEYNESESIYWVNHSGYMEFIVNNQTEDIENENVIFQGDFGTGFFLEFKIMEFYMIIMNTGFSPENFSMYLYADFYYKRWEYPASTSWYILLSFIIFNLTFISIAIYIYRKKKM